MKRATSKSHSLYVGKRRTLRFTHVPDEVAGEAVEAMVRAQPTHADFQDMRDTMMRVVWPLLAFGLVAVSIMGAAEIGGYDAAFIAARF